MPKLIAFSAKYLARNIAGYFVLILVSREKMRNINQQIYPFKNESDVLAIPFTETQQSKRSEKCYGEIYLNYEMTKIQAQTFGHSWLRECAFLVLHAVMHLWGYVHKTKNQEKLMIGLQEEILTQLKIFRG